MKIVQIQAAQSTTGKPVLFALVLALAIHAQECEDEPSAALDAIITLLSNQ